MIASAASFQDIETDWNWLAKYLLETLGKLLTGWFTLLYSMPLSVGFESKVQEHNTVPWLALEP